MKRFHVSFGRMAVMLFLLVLFSVFGRAEAKIALTPGDWKAYGDSEFRASFTVTPEGKIASVEVTVVTKTVSYSDSRVKAGGT